MTEPTVEDTMLQALPAILTVAVKGNRSTVQKLCEQALTDHEVRLALWTIMLGWQVQCPDMALNLQVAAAAFNPSPKPIQH